MGSRMQRAWSTLKAMIFWSLQVAMRVNAVTSFLTGCHGLTSLNLSPLSQVTEVPGFFLSGCCGLTSLDLSPLSQVTELSVSFLSGCSGLTKLDLSPLSGNGGPRVFPKWVLWADEA